MSSEILETSSSETLEKPWPKPPTPNEYEVVEVAVQPVESAAAGEDRTAGIEDELGPCVRREEAVEEAADEVITTEEGAEIADEEAGDDGLAIPAEKGDVSDTAAGIVG